MAVFRPRKDPDPSGDVPPGAEGPSTPAGAPAGAPKSDRTRSVVKGTGTGAQVTRQAARIPGRGPVPGGAPLSTSSDSRSFVKDTITELKRVVWPTRETVRAGTVVTIGLLIFFSMYLFFLDTIVERVFRAMGFYS